MYKANKGLAVYADTFGIPREMSFPFITLFSNYIKNNGEEFAVRLFKDIKLSFITRKAHPGCKYFVPWLRHGSVNHKGPIGALERWCEKSHKRWSKVIKLLGIYTTIYSSTLLDAQEKKFLEGVLAVDVEVPDDIRELIHHSAHDIKEHFNGRRHTVLRPPKHLWEYSVSKTRRAPLPSGETYPEDQMVWKTLLYTRFTSFGMGIRGRFRGIFDPLEHGIDVDFPDDTPDSVCFRNSVGKIGFIQEPGMKLRAVANPGRIYQCALRPLGDSLFRIAEGLPWDCTFDQKKAIPHIQQHLSNKGVCHSVDLTGATDYFPLSLQMDLLKSLYKEDRLGYVDLFYMISRGEWLYSSTKPTIRWTKGQPLGLYPSFPAFAITHGALLYALNDFVHDNQFFILGDDVVIMSDDLYERYISVMKRLECPISASKSISSSEIAEFAGKIITQDDVILQLKWRHVSDDSFLDTMRNLGPTAISLLRPRQKKICKLLMEVPDFMGGLGYNPHGLPLAERVYRSLVLLGDPRVRSYLLSLNRFVTTNNYTSGHGNISFVLEIFDPDKGFKDLVACLLPILKQWYDIAGGNLWLKDPDLKLMFKTSDRNSTLLEQLESILL